MVLNKNTWQKIALIALFMLTIAAIWCPFGFSLGAVIEEWGVLGTFTANGLFFISTLSTPFAPHALRPLTIYPHALAYFFDSNSFYYWHVLLITSLLVKGLSTSYLIFKVTKCRYWSLFAGILIIIYPADTMQLAFRGTHINWSLSLVLLASSFFIAALNVSRSTFYYGLSVLAALCLFASITMYEAAFALSVLPFIVLFMQVGWHSSIQRLWSSKMLVLCWLASICLYVIYVIIISPQIQTYQQSFIGEQKFTNLLFRLPKLFGRGLLREVVGAWFDAIRIVILELSWYAYAYLAFVVTMVYLTLKFVANSVKQQTNKALFLRLVMGGLILIMTGYIPYIFSESHLSISQRTFLFASLGGVIFWVACVMQLAYSRKILAQLAVVSMLFFGLGSQLYQFHYYVEVSIIQNRILKNIVENYNPALENKTLVLLDEGNRLNRVWMFLLSNLQNALTYVYHKQIPEIKLCYMPSGNLQQNSYPYNKMGKCVDKGENWEFNSFEASKDGQSEEKKSTVLNKNDVVTLRIKPDGTIDKNPLLETHRQNLMQNDNATALRYRNILADKQWPSYFEFLWSKPKADQYTWQFGKWWSLETPFRGNGWGEPQWQVNKFYHTTMAWKTQKTASILFDIQPRPSNYRLNGYFPYIMNEDIKNNIVIEINKHKVIYHWIKNKNNKFEGIIPNGVLVEGTNTIEFIADLDKTFHLSFNLDSFQIMPEA